ncbi:alpha/beta hydrolase fold domain-containing protein [Treponema pectinovorum]|uniref:alpha/beta hydrolase fold domain-containing protein n=1 Tax=Treponema pectinovorum TaxID=164 RepID=UPI0011CBB9A3|nr:alpha/beta hydrolase [Treponema pectinovorum]
MAYYERKLALKKLKALYFSTKAEVKDFRQKMEELFEEPILPNGVDFEEKNYSTVPCDILSPILYSTRRIILYIHGGCFVGGSRKVYRAFVASLASSLSSRAVVPEFRLAPTHPYPASLDDVQTVFRSIYTEELVANSLDNASDLQKSKPEIIIMADGSGASIAMGLILSLKERFRLSVKKVVLFSPWLDVSVDSQKFQKKKSGDNLTNALAIKKSAELYTFQESRNSPLVSPLKATREQLENFPPVYIQIGEDEFLRDDAENLKAKFLDSGIECEVDVFKGMPAMFQMADEYFKESHLAIERIGSLFTKRKIDSSDSQTEILLSLETKNAKN